MDIFNIPIAWQIGVLVALTALYVFLRGIELPRDYYKKQAARMELKRKIAEMEKEQVLLTGESQNKSEN